MPHPFLLFFAFVLSLSFGFSTAFASRRVGNGGNLVVCYNDMQPETRELLDIFEARRLDKAYRLGLGDAEKTVEEKIESVLVNLARVSPLRSEYYRKVYQSFLESDLYVEADFPVLEDSGELATPIPSNCEIQQVAMQFPDPFKIGGRKLLLYLPYFIGLSTDQKAAVYIHELVTTEATEWGATTSANIRPFVASLVSSKFGSLSEEEFITSSIEAGLKAYEANGFTFMYDSAAKEMKVPVFQNGKLLEGSVVPGTKVRVRNETNEKPVFVRDQLRFDTQGRVSQFTLLGDQWIPLKGNQTEFVGDGAKIEIDAAGFVVNVIKRARR